MWNEMKVHGYFWKISVITFLGLCSLCYPTFSQVETLDTLKSNPPVIDTTLPSTEFGIERPGTIADTIRIQTKAVGHSPRKAILLAAVLPGLGQAYNGKYWKIPVLYGGILTVGYGIALQNERLSVFRQARLAVDRGAENENPLTGTRIDNQRIDRGIEVYNRGRDFMVIIMAGVYALGIVDAIVDAHLKEFEVNEDLSFHIKPSVEQMALIQGFQYNVGLALTLTIK